MTINWTYPVRAHFIWNDALIYLTFWLFGFRLHYSNLGGKTDSANLSRVIHPLHERPRSLNWLRGRLSFYFLLRGKPSQLSRQTGLLQTLNKKRVPRFRSLQNQGHPS